jgi:hypothetical protein
MLLAYTEERYADALRAWKALDRSEADMGVEEKFLVADSAARVGSDEDLALLDLAFPVEREVLHAFRATRRRDSEKAAASLVRAFTLLRTTPWVRRRIRQLALDLTADIAIADPKQTSVLYDALRVPFAVEAAREQRLFAAAKLASALPDPATCVNALQDLEPPPWNRAMLELRARCYQRAHDPRTAAAEQDLLEVVGPTTELGASIPTPPQPPHAAKNDAGAEEPPR